MNVIRATPVTPYVSNPSALGPTESPALSPVQSAITPGLRASSSLILKTIFIRSEPMSAIFVKMPPAIQGSRAERLADGEADEARACVVARDEEKDAEHDEQLDRDEHHADGHSRLQRYRVNRVRLAFERRERGARVGERVDADAEPRDAVGACDADEAEEQDDDDLEEREAVREPPGVVNRLSEEAEVDCGDGPDEDPQQHDEAPLRDEVGRSE